MFRKGKLTDFLHPRTLRFTSPDLEARFTEAKDEQIRRFICPKISLIILTIIQSVICVYFTILVYRNGGTKIFWTLVSTVIVLNLALVIEYFIHTFKGLRLLRSFTATTVWFCVIFYVSSVYSDTPSISLT